MEIRVKCMFSKPLATRRQIAERSTWARTQAALVGNSLVIILDHNENEVPILLLQWCSRQCVYNKLADMNHAKTKRRHCIYRYLDTFFTET